VALSHADRSHICGATGAHWPTDGLHWSALAVDGFVACAWRLIRDRKAATLVVRLLGPVPAPTAPRPRRSSALLAFVAPDAEQHQVHVAC
jgi:hypothetical protein